MLYRESTCKAELNSLIIVNVTSKLYNYLFCRFGRTLMGSRKKYFENENGKKKRVVDCYWF